MSESDNIVVRPEGEGSILRTDKLVKRYGKRTVANGVSINVKQGEIVGLLGPNGAGKTTSFYMTTGLVVPNEGHVYIDDQEITNFPVYKRARAGIGYLPQEASVFRKMSVEDNIMSVLEMTKLSKQERIDKMESLIREFRLGRYVRILETDFLVVSVVVVRLLVVWLLTQSLSCLMSLLQVSTLLPLKIFSTLFGV